MIKINENRLVRLQVNETADGSVDSSYHNWNAFGSVARGVELVLTEDFSPLFANEFKSPLSFVNDVQGKVENIKNVVEVLSSLRGTAGGSGVTARNVYTARKIWSNVSTVTFTLNFEFYFGMADEWQGRTEVYNPVMRLLQLSSPNKVTGGFLSPAGAGIKSVATQFFKGTGSEAFNYKKYSVQVGQMVFNDVLIKTVDPVWSNDIDDKGFPIRADVSIEFETQQLAHRQMFVTK